MILKFFLFNPLVKLYLNSGIWVLDFNNRIKSAILEMWFALSVFIPWLFIGMIPQMFAVGVERENIAWHEWVQSALGGALIIVMFNKDFFNGQSAVHRKLGYQVVARKTNLPASKFRCLLRNITAPLWPVEAIFLLTSRERRLGDLIAGTRLIAVPPSDPETLLADMGTTKLDKDGFFTLAVSLIFVIAMTIYSNQ